MQLPHLHYRVVGQDDYTLEISVEPDGTYRVDCGDHTSHEPRQGRLDARQKTQLATLVKGLGAPREHAPPPGAIGFVAELTLDSPPGTAIYRVWEGAMEEEPDVLALVRALEVI